jgi:ABC-type polysaccharide/polyol phosphate transport system ATPase subunit
MSSEGTGTRAGTSAIVASGVGKSYRIGGAARERATTLGERLVDVARAPFRARPDATTLWALQDVSFDIKAGDAVGIIGRNGAGKSTLLKILSRITSPTTGELCLRGRVGSLLEVGTGFHPELTGRENIYLNGAILGMRRREIARRFDEIVAFAEVDRFLETPVKRYSSGMYVRLAFAVAAHLEPEILVVDEVLAVGDAEFQRKCLGKMGEVALEGRTVVFVSHAMQAVSSLTRRVLVLEKGRLVFDGATAEGLAHYRAMQGGRQPASYAAADVLGNDAPATRNRVRAARVLTSDGGSVHRWGEPLALEFELDVPEPTGTLCFSCKLVDADDRNIAHLWCFERDARFRRDAGRYRLRFEVPRARIFQGAYTVSAFLSDRRTNAMFEELHAITPFEVTMDGIARDDYAWTAGDCTYLEDAEWVLTHEGAGEGDRAGTAGGAPVQRGRIPAAEPR